MSNDKYPVTVIPEYLTQNFDPAVVKRAQDMYLLDGDSLIDVAVACGVSAAVVASWSTQLGWRRRRSTIEAELAADADSEYRKLIRKHRSEVAARDIQVGGKLVKAIENKIDEARADEDAKPGELRTLAEALASATAVTARAVGLSDRPTSDPLLIEDQGGKNKKVPLVMINISHNTAKDDGRIIEVKEGEL